jgi:hypothetical protein
VHLVSHSLDADEAEYKHQTPGVAATGPSAPDVPATGPLVSRNVDAAVLRLQRWFRR